jgi:carboxyl-terminal processing protease
LPPQMDRLSMVLDASASLTNFATEYVRSHKIPENFEATGETLDELQVFLSARDIRPSVSDWLNHRQWIQSRVTQEIMNQAFGVAKGDEVELHRDPVVQRALEKLRKK